MRSELWDPGEAVMDVTPGSFTELVTTEPGFKEWT